MKAQILLKNIQWQGSHNPTFKPGETRIAVAELLNPTASILPYKAELYLNKPKMVTSGTIFFNIDTSQIKKINFPISMPKVEGTYPVFLDIFSNSQLLITYRADEDIIIGIPTKVVKIALKNPPSEATQWQLILYDWNKTRITSKFYIAITDPVIFEIPPETIFPLRVDMIIYHPSTIDYRMQSVGTEFPFPSAWFEEAFIPDYGSYYYNVVTEQFEVK